ncbi:HU family DNA-binding protein [Rhodobacter capsulatus]|jgi:nucleoid DNA-binding protein|uniref:DNA-binding protein HU-2 n=1 Tax=Rhodobacter capsulatus (strain ATCC BAA-309 / NBRC 16581 / SB1003) TaxID=272942 RepID=D5AQV3_RHOCB|nr:HU family DNA-binding protein [Rhodobacter capsulatus]YP_004934664.1 DNA binding protein [Rhodobacter phage RcapMu]ADE84759.1 DNA-binding protein HU-2 [Rhodobacter capsulatus SB 1003]AER29944.1 DNA-binding protein HU [Rhodobacter phage RcapMu]MDS0926507.1 HU family DNA-binding protein [Rhodobacter capsulatus]
MGKTFSKSDLVDAVAAQTGFAKTNVKDMLDATLGVITAQTEAGSKVTLMGFGSFEQRQKKARMGRNPATGEQVEIPASAHLAFKPAKPKKS